MAVVCTSLSCAADLQVLPSEVMAKGAGKSADGLNVDALAQFVLATMGAGIVTVPAVFKALGINLGLIVLVIAAVLTLMATWLLVSASLNTARNLTYEEIGDKLAPWIFHSATAFNFAFNFLGVVSFITLMDGYLRKIMSYFGNTSETASVAALFAVGLVLIVLLSASAMSQNIGERIDSIRKPVGPAALLIVFVSVVGSFFLSYYTAPVVIQDASGLSFWSLFGPVSNLIMAYMNQTIILLVLSPLGGFPDLWRDIPHHGAVTDEVATKSSLFKHIVAGQFFVVLIYATFGTSGYLSFGQDVKGNILDNFDFGLAQPSMVWTGIRICACLAVFSTTYVYGKLFRGCIFKIAGHNPASQSRTFTVVCVALLVLIPVLITTLRLPFELILSFVGASTAVPLVFHFPSIFYLYSHTALPTSKMGKLSVALCVGIGSVFWIIGTYLSGMALLSKA